MFLAQNQIIDISPLKNLDNIVVLMLYDNKISDISPLENLIEITDLLLDNNRIKDIKPLKKLKKLNIRLRLERNHIEVLPPWITDFNMEINWDDSYPEKGNITFYQNPLKSPPPEIVKQGKEAVRNYFEQLGKSTKRISIYLNLSF